MRRIAFHFLAASSAGATLVAGFQNCSGAKGFLVASSAGSSYCSVNPSDAACTSSGAAICSFNGQSVAEGASVVAYLNSTGTTSTPCASQTRSCLHGILGGSYAYASCANASGDPGIGGPPSGGQAASCLFNGQTILSGQHVIAYLTSTVGFGSSCQSQDRVCTNGALSGNSAYASCQPQAPAACLFDGRTIPHGQTVVGFVTPTVPTGQACVPYTRTCYNGALSSQGDYGSCTVSSAATCSFGGRVINSGETVTAYASSSVPFGAACAGSARTCQNGALSGTGDFASCAVAQPSACSVNGQTVPHGGTITLYTTAQATTVQACETEVRTCANGSLSGSATAGSCKTADGASCPIGWICPARPILPPTTTVGTWYTTYWYGDGVQPNHWADYTRYRPSAGNYGSGDPAAIQREFQQMTNVGIDYVVLDDTNGVHNDNGLIATNVESIFQTAQNMTGFGRLPVAIALGVQGLSLAAVNDEANYVAGFTQRFPQIYKTWQGQPLLLEFGPYDVANSLAPEIATWRDSRFTVRHAAYHSSAANPLLRQNFSDEGLWGWVLDEPLFVSPETIAVSPGYNRSHFDHASPDVDREGGNRYVRQWLAAVKYRPQNIFIPSWNDFGEETQIAPSVPNGNQTFVAAPAWTDTYGNAAPDWYTQITLGYTALRSGLANGVSYRDEDNAGVYLVADGRLVPQAVMPTGKPVIVLPAQTLASILNSAQMDPMAAVNQLETIHRLRNGDGDYLFSYSPDEVRTATTIGYVEESTPFQLYTSATATRNAVYRCFAGNAGHFLSLASDCEGATSDGRMGYAERVATVLATTPLDRCRHIVTGKHLETTRVTGECNAASSMTVEPMARLGFVP